MEILIFWLDEIQSKFKVAMIWAEWSDQKDLEVPSNTKNYEQNYAKCQLYLTGPVGFFYTLWYKKRNAQTAKAEPFFMAIQLLTEIEWGFAS